MEEKKIITINCGSTSFKYKFIVIDKNNNINEIFTGSIDNIGTSNCSLNKRYKGNITKEPKSFTSLEDAAQFLISELFVYLKNNSYINNYNDIYCFAYKVAHGGNKYYEPIIVDITNINKIAKYNLFAPSHNPNFIKIAKVFIKKFPKIKNIFYFETVFHKNLEKHKRIYATPYEWLEKYEILHYGFHSAAHTYSLYTISNYLKRNDLKIVSCHLGGGSSIAAIKNGKSFDISSGFTPNSGTIMTTRAGDFDPYVLIYLLKNKFFSLEELEEKLSSDSGLKGISGLSSDFREIVDASENGNIRAKLAIETFCYSVAKYVLSYIGLLKGFDVLTFSGGIGENSYVVRQKVCSYLDFFGAVIDKDKNKNGEFLLSSASSKAKIFRISCNEEFMVLKTIFNI